MKIFKAAIQAKTATGVSHSKHIYIGLAIFVIAGLVTAAYVLLRVQAATVPGALQAEDATLNARAAKISDATASGSMAVRLGPAPVAPTPTPPAPTPTPTPPTPSPTAPSTSLRGQKLYVYKPAEWQSRPAEIYNNQVGKWYGNWSGNVQQAVNTVVSAATARGEVPLFVAYNIPGRDCGSYSAGGAGNSANYRAWIRQFAAGVGNRKAIVVLEPDALAQLDCLNGADQNARIADIADAVNVFAAQTKAYVYVDGGNPTWKDVPTMVDRLKRANVAKAAGFSLNVSNFKFTQDNVTYGDNISRGLASVGVPGERYVVDTSRNGKGPNGSEWCNPLGRGLGKKPTTSPTTGQYSDAFLWIKTIGESDGPCNGGPGAGQWFPSYAQMLIQNAVY